MPAGAYLCLHAHIVFATPVKTTGCDAETPVTPVILQGAPLMLVNCSASVINTGSRQGWEEHEAVLPAPPTGAPSECACQ